MGGDCGTAAGVTLRSRLIPISFFVPVLLHAGCGTDSIGVEACRKIEQARCEAAAQCGLIDDVSACQRFFRDHCLHGIALAEEPGSVVEDRCVDALRLAGECAEAKGRKTAPTKCNPDLFKKADADQICELVEEPERAFQCSFLSEVQEPKPQLVDEPDSGK